MVFSKFQEFETLRILKTQKTTKFGPKNKSVQIIFLVKDPCKIIVMTF